MSIRDDIINDIRAIFSGLSTTVISNSNASDIFEAYVFSLIIRAAEDEGGDISFIDVNGSVASKLIFRTSPGYIYSRLKPYTHAVIRFTGKPNLETHVGIMVAGRSEVLHECDVVVIDQSEAETCRRERVQPRATKLLISVECKFYSAQLKLDLARSFLGLVKEFSGKDLFFVSNTNSENVEKVFSKHKAKWDHRIIPTSTNEVIRIKNQFQTVFKDYKAK